jgi:ABC-type polysaccharide/polyol phosphate export permease
MVYQMKITFQELIKGFKLVHIWKNLAWSDILQRYKRTVIGPLWGVITTGIIILFVGPVYSRLFGQKLEEYFPYIALSYILWNFLSTLIQEMSN